jgi:hypothetical protein
VNHALSQHIPHNLRCADLSSHLHFHHLVFAATRFATNQTPLSSPGVCPISGHSHLHHHLYLATSLRGFSLNEAVFSFPAFDFSGIILGIFSFYIFALAGPHSLRLDQYSARLLQLIKRPDHIDSTMASLGGALNDRFVFTPNSSVIIVPLT